MQITATARLKGGKGSGHFGHRGRPGHVGGSLPSGSGYVSNTPVTNSDKKLYDAIEVYDRFMKESGHITQETIVFEYGKFFQAPEIGSELPDWCDKGKNKECYYNSFMNIGNMPKDVYYTEGFAFVSGMDFPFAHGWLTTKDGQVIDPTWNDGVAYFGIRLDTDYVIDKIAESGYAGVICNDWMCKNTIAKEGFPPGTLIDTIVEKGGPGSGHHGHRGRPGLVGGSLPGEGYSTTTISDDVDEPFKIYIAIRNGEEITLTFDTEKDWEDYKWNRGLSTSDEYFRALYDIGESPNDMTLAPDWYNWQLAEGIISEEDYIDAANTFGFALQDRLIEDPLAGIEFVDFKPKESGFGSVGDEILSYINGEGYDPTDKYSDWGSEYFAEEREAFVDMFRIDPFDRNQLVDTLKGIEDLYDLEGFREKIRIADAAIGDIRIRAEFLTDAGDWAGSSTLTLRSNDLGERWVYWNGLEFSKDFMNKNIVTQAYMQSMVKLSHLGFDSLRTEAGLTIGRYAWAKKGFDYDPEYSFSVHTARQKLFEWLTIDKTVIGERLGIKSIDDLPEFKTAYDVATYDGGFKMYGAEIDNRDVPREMPFNIGKAFMLDDGPRGHGCWHGVLDLSKFRQLKGGPGSGHFGHRGRPGKVGGSRPDDDGKSFISPHRTRITRFRKLMSKLGKEWAELHKDSIYRLVRGNPELIDIDTYEGWPKTETAMIIDSDGKTVLDIVTQDHESQVDLESVGDILKGSFLLHNHPETNGGFSFQDILFAIANKLRGMYVVTPEEVFAIEFWEDTSEEINFDLINFLKSVWNRSISDVKTYLQNEIDVGRITKKEAAKLHGHELAKAALEALGKSDPYTRESIRYYVKPINTGKFIYKVRLK